ncbi:MAG: hypothetical protein ACPIOQ_81955 [Promethearchaeia archaeon]
MTKCSVSVGAMLASSSCLFALPPAQKYPDGHGTPDGDDHREGQYLPTLAVHGCLLFEPPMQYQPAGHCTPAADRDPPGQNKPLATLQSEQVADDLAPMLDE